jgi:fused signal recognition particle receptor
MSGWLKALSRTREVLRGVTRFVLGGRALDGATLEELEMALIRADVAPRLVAGWVEELRRPGSVTDPAVRLEELLRRQIPERPAYSWPDRQPTVILIPGVNGSGKTTTAAKLAWQIRQAGKVPLLAAGDTFRAAGTDQLRIWAGRAGCEIVSGKQGSDPAAVAFDAVQAAVARRCDVVLIDTAGRMHTKTHLMDELRKVQRAIAKAMPGAPHEAWIVLDAMLGHNAVVQARMFQECIGLTGAVISKLDGSSKAGFVVTIEAELKIPVLFAGLGEGLEDLEPFNSGEFIRALLAPPG